MHAVAGAVLVVAAPVAAWGLMGQQDYDGLPPSELDYAMEPWRFPAGLETALGAVALLLAALSALRLVRATRSGALDPRRWQVLIPLLAAGTIAAVGLRTMTAGVIGANIGAGLVEFFAGPVVAALLLWSLGCGAWQRFGGRHTE